MEESRLVKMVVRKPRELRRKFELDNEVELVGRLMNTIKARNEKD